MMEKTRIIIIIGFQERLENKHYIMYVIEHKHTYIDTEQNY